MTQNRNPLLENFFNALISGDRATAHSIMNDAIDTEAPAPSIIDHLIWPSLSHIQEMRRKDQLSALAYHYATRLLRQLIDQLQMRLQQAERNGLVALVVTGAEEAEELAGQLACDLMEAAGYTIHLAGGGIANDEMVEEVGKLNIDKLVIFGAVASTVPTTRLLIDRLHEIGICPNMQIIVGGGIFNRADGLAEEIGADLWCKDPIELIQVLQERPDRRMTPDQRTVGRKRKTTKAA